MAAGYTTLLVPTTRHRSQVSSSSCAASEKNKKSQFFFKLHKLGRYETLSKTETVVSQRKKKIQIFWLMNVQAVTILTN
jgi:hypothetical protein